jgi:hypothetical protein
MNVPNEAVDAVARSLHSFEDHREDWDNSHSDEREYYLNQARTILNVAGPIIARQTLQDAALDAEGIISRGDVAEVAAPVPGECGRNEAVYNRDVLYEEPAAWIRERAASLRANE